MTKKRTRSSITGRHIKRTSSRVGGPGNIEIKREPKAGRYTGSKADKNSRVLATTIGGALIGNMLVPGLGGAIVGGLAGAFLGNTSDEEAESE